MQGEKSQSKNDKYSMILLIQGTQGSHQVHREQNGEAAGKGELLFNEYRFSGWEEGKVREMDSADGCKTTRMYLMQLKYALKKGY